MRTYTVLLLVLAGNRPALSGERAGPVSDLKSDEVIAFFPTIGFSIENGKAWQCAIHGWVYEPRSKEISLEWVWEAFGLLGEPQDDTEKEAIRSERAGRFLVDNERNKHIVIRFDGRAIELGASEVNGHFTGDFSLSADEVAALRSASGGKEGSLRYRAVLREGDTREFSGAIHLLSPTGLAVISDIDDTIKMTEVSDRKAMIRNTFLEEYRAVPGMAALYQKWAVLPGSAFHYVSASPWQLYEPLEEFRGKAGFPAGSFHLRPLRVKDQSLFDFMESPRAFKTETIEVLIKAGPLRSFVLVGDSGQDDPEIYGELARRFPERVVRIFIRNTTDQPREHERYGRAFRDVPVAVWNIFREPAEIAGPLP